MINEDSSMAFYWLLAPVATTDFFFQESWPEFYGNGGLYNNLLADIRALYRILIYLNDPQKGLNLIFIDESDNFSILKPFFGMSHEVGAIWAFIDYKSMAIESEPSEEYQIPSFPLRWLNFRQ